VAIYCFVINILQRRRISGSKTFGDARNTQIIGSVWSIAMRTSFWKSSDLMTWAYGSESLRKAMPRSAG
jgi:hypothetical protein